MKRIFAGLMSGLIVLSLCGCGKEALPYNMKQIRGAILNEEFVDKCKKNLIVYIMKNIMLLMRAM